MKNKVKFIIHIRRSGKKLALLFFCFPLLFSSVLYPLAEWSVVTYIQADNNLALFAHRNIRAMKRVTTSPDVNILVQWDQPENNKTWRYKVEKNKLIEAGSLDAEMGTNPEAELIDMMQWVKKNYPAKKYMMVLWNHGNGVLDRNKKLKTLTSWMEIPGAPRAINRGDRGILYDDSQGTFLSNQGLTRVLNKVHNEILGQPLDVLGMDACLMSMIEVAYQVKDHAHFMVGSENIEPGEGWSYDRFLTQLVENPQEIGAKELSQAIVDAYGKLYEGSDECTQSAIDLSKIEQVKTTIDLVATTLRELNQLDSKQTKTLVNYVKKNVLRFETNAYIDLHNFYSCAKEKSYAMRKNKTTPFAQALERFEGILDQAMAAIQDAVVANVVGSSFFDAQGISIYWPKGKVDETYLNTIFAQTSPWLDFINNR